MAHSGASHVSGSSSHLPIEEETTAEEYMEPEQDRLQPIASMTRIMKKILPPDARISSDAKKAVQKCVTEYITFITGEANDRCRSEERRTITAMDVIWAMSKLGFDDYVQPLMLYLHRYRELEGDYSARQPVEYGRPIQTSPSVEQMLRSSSQPHHPDTEYLGYSESTAMCDIMKSQSDAGSSSQQG